MSAANGKLSDDAAMAGSEAVSLAEDNPREQARDIMAESPRPRPSTWEGASGPFLEDLLAGQIDECKIHQGTSFDLHVPAEEYDDMQSLSLTTIPRGKLLAAEVQMTTSEVDGSLCLGLPMRAEGNGLWKAAWRQGARVCSPIYAAFRFDSFAERPDPQALC